MTYVESSPDQGGHHPMSPITPAEDARSIMLNRVSWGAVLAGVVVALVTQLLLNMLGLGIGVATLDPGSGDNPAASTLSIAAGIWWTLSGIVAAFVGGYVAGRMSGKPMESTAGWHGLTAWALTTLLIFYLLTSAIGGLIGGALGTLGNALGGLSQSAAQVAAPVIANADPFGTIEEQVRASGDDPAAMRDAAVAAVRAAVTGSDTQGQQQAAEALARAQGIPVADAEAQVARYAEQYKRTVDQAQATATEAADAAATAVATGALFGFLALVLGAIAAWFGGRFGTVEPTFTAFAARIRRQ